jgi:uncharacterized membrane protein YcjF (UPF0283 family)
MPGEPTIACKFAQERFRNAALWKNLWSILLIVFGTAVIIFAVIAIFFFIRQDWLPGALITLGTLVEGAGIKWVTDRRSDAAKEETEAYLEIGKVCNDTTGADKLKRNLRFL